MEIHWYIRICLSLFLILSSIYLDMKLLDELVILCLIF
jgi:hypothetical protein